MDYVYFTIEGITFRVDADYEDTINSLIHAPIERVLGRWDTNYQPDGYNFIAAKTSVHNFNPKE